MNPAEWLHLGGKRLPVVKKSADGPAAHIKPAQEAPEMRAVASSLSATTSSAPASSMASGVHAPPPAASRSTKERLNATLRQKDEALSPRELRRTLQELRAIVDPQVSEIEGGRRGQAIALWYATASPPERHDLWLLMSEQFVADPQKSSAAQAQLAAAIGTPDEAAAEVRFRRQLHRVCQWPRRAAPGPRWIFADRRQTARSSAATSRAALAVTPWRTTAQSPAPAARPRFH